MDEAAKVAPVELEGKAEMVRTALVIKAVLVVVVMVEKVEKAERVAPAERVVEVGTVATVATSALHILNVVEPAISRLIGRQERVDKVLPAD